MAGIFISHRATSEDEVKDFVGHFLVRKCGVQPWHVFTTFQGTEVPPGSMTGGRVLRALLDAPIVIVWGDADYFNSKNCLIELGASLAARGEVFYLLSPSISWSDIPQEFLWIAWKYSHDPNVLTQLESSVEQSYDIDSEPQLAVEGYRAWPGQLSVQSENNLSDYSQKWPKLVESRPFHFPAGRKNAYFGLTVWQLENGRIVPIVYAEDDQTSVMNSDALVEHLKSRYSVSEVYALWPDENLGVCAHSGKGGGTRRNVEDELREFGIPSPQDETPAEPREIENYFSPRWFKRWAKNAENS